MSQPQTQIMHALRELGGETNWVALSVIFCMIEDVSLSDLQSLLGELEQSKQIWRATLIEKTYGIPESRHSPIFKIREQNHGND